jgi:hypothetical protein
MATAPQTVKVTKDNGGKVKDKTELQKLLAQDPAMVKFDLSNPRGGHAAGSSAVSGDKLPKGVTLQVEGLKDTKVAVDKKGVPTVV